MQIISTNIAEPTTISWKGRQLQTGYYKKPTNQPIYLGKYDVKGDNVIDRRYHGGEFKACYIFSANHYSYWKRLYANLNWEYGMFGENLTVSGFNETQVQIGNIYKVGETLVQVTQPREPCFKVGIKFGTQKVLEQFIEHGYPGTYLRVLKEGTVSTGDEFELVKKNVNSLTVHQFFNLLFAKTKDQELLKLAIKNDALPLSKREKLKTFLR
jgi:MOSC domain-containing protein YiiM